MEDEYKMSIMECANEIGLFAKIPNDFFYEEGKRLEEIGGRHGFLVYCLITSRKAMNNKVYLSIKGITDVLNFGSNASRARLKVIEVLVKLRKDSLIAFNTAFEDLSARDVFEIEWIDTFKKSNKSGWTKFYANDFELQYKMGDIAYLTMWVLRMHANHVTGYSFISVSKIAGILRCNINKVQNSIHLFQKTGLFEIVKGSYYTPEGTNQRIRKNNQYKYTYNIENVLY